MRFSVKYRNRTSTWTVPTSSRPWLHKKEKEQKYNHKNNPSVLLMLWYSQRRVARSVKNYLHPHISDQIVSLHKALKKSVSQVSKHSLFQTLNMIFCAVMLLYYQSLEVFLFSCCCNQLPTAVSGVRGAILSPCPVFLCIMCCFNIVVHPIATFESNTLPSLFIRICSMMCASTR